MKLPMQELLKEELFSWMGEAELNVLSNCFDMEVERLPEGRTAAIGSRIGYQLSGSARLSCGKETADIASGAVFGVPWAENTGNCLAETAITAWEDCRIIWADKEIMQSVCYRACWFHGRFITEVNKKYGCSRRKGVPEPVCPFEQNIDRKQSFS